MPPQPSASARERLAARARRVARIRRRVAAATFAAFVLAWGVIAHDGPMGATTTSSTEPATAASAEDSATTGAWDDPDSSSASGPAPVTTAQS